MREHVIQKDSSFCGTAIGRLRRHELGSQWQRNLLGLHYQKQVEEDRNIIRKGITPKAQSCQFCTLVFSVLRGQAVLIKVRDGL